MWRQRLPAESPDDLLKFAGLLALVIVAPVAAGEKPDTSALVKGNTRFALELYGKLRGGEGNLFLSPFSGRE